MRVLVVEDEVRIADVVRRALSEAGHAVDVALDGPSALEAFDIEEYDLVVLDLMLPGIEGGGLEVCRVIRAHSSNVPILILTALDGPHRTVAGLDAGADDYLVKPFHVAELVARVRALLRRAPRADPPVLRAGGLVLDPATRSARSGERTVPLTAKEYAVLEYLMRNAGRMVSTTQLIDHAWDSNYQGMSNVVQTYIRYLRAKLAELGEPDAIQTRRGHGYVIDVDR